MRTLVLLALAATLVPAESPRSIRGIGQATLTAKPDRAGLSVGVVTQSSTAQDAAARNATASCRVIAALQQTLGANASVETSSYSLTPNYQYSQNASPILIGFTATNTLLAAIDDLSLIGAAIDAANQAGANSIGGLTFGLKDSDPLRQQALTAAAKQARDHAQAIAAGLSRSLGAVLLAHENSTVSPIAAPTIAGGGLTTPIVPELVSVGASVVVEFEVGP
jgi:uncharacterized protein YggE